MSEGDQKVKYQFNNIIMCNFTANICCKDSEYVAWKSITYKRNFYTLSVI